MSLDPVRPVLRLITFGGLALESSSPLGAAGTQRSRLALLAVLAASRSGISRDKLLALLWPDSSTERARNALRQSLFALRRDLRCDDLTIGSTELRLNPAAVSSDVTEFDTAIAAGDLEGAAAVYAGPFLDGVHLRGALEFERWLDGERSQRAARAAGALVQLAERAEALGQFTVAVAHWRTLSTIEPLSDRIAIGLMRALAATGDTVPAIAHARSFERLVQNELQTAADPAVGALAGELSAAAAAASPGADRIAISISASPLPPAADITAASPRDPVAGGRGAHRSLGPRRPKVALAVMATITALAYAAFARGNLGARGNPVSRLDAEDDRIALGRVTVTPFENATGDSAHEAFGRLASDWVVDGIAQTGLIDDLAPPSGRRTLVVGRILSASDSLVVAVRVVDGPTGHVLRIVPVVAGPASEPMQLLEDLRRQVGGAIASLADPRVSTLMDVSARPPTLEAYKHYIAGQSSFSRDDFTEAVAHFRRAADADTMFSLPLVWLAFSHSNTGETGRRDSVVDRLALRRERLGPIDTHALDYFLAVRRGDVDAQYRHAVLASRLAPQSTWMLSRALLATQLGRYGEAIGALRSLDPERSWLTAWPLYFFQLARNHHLMGDHRAELAVALDAAARRPEIPGFVDMRVRALAALGRVRELRQLLDSASGDARSRGGQGERYRVAGLELLRHGHAAPARQYLADCVTWYDGQRQSGQLPVQAEFRRAECLYAMARGDSAFAAYTRITTQVSSTPEVRAVAWHRLAVLSLRAGNPSVAAIYEARFMSVFPWNEAAPKVATLAEIGAVLRGDRAEALAELQARWQTKVPDAPGWHTDVDLQPMWTYKPFERWLRRRD